MESHHRQMNRTYINKYFNALKEELEKNNLVSKSDRIWNMDETWMVLEQKPTKVLAWHGARYLHSIPVVEAEN